MNRIEQGRNILKMIEAADVNDTDALDEIDILAWCFFAKEKFIGYVNNERWYFDTDYLIGRAARGKPQYTRSLDEIHKVMPYGWKVGAIIRLEKGFIADLFEGSGRGQVGGVGKMPQLPTMHLAWLHAIISAYIYMERCDA